MGKFIMNGIEYTSSPMNGFPPLIYSDEEREVGVWRDGKPLYQKTIVSDYVFHTTQEIGIPIDVHDLNIDTPVSINGFWRRWAGDNAKLWYQFGSEESTYGIGWARIDSENNYPNGRLMIKIHSDGTDLQIVTLQYTKTTDVAGSGRYTTYGGLTHHYSTSEQVVGTWIDGKPLYELVIDYDNTSGLNSGSTTIATIATGLNIIPGGINAILYNNSDGRQYILPYAKTDGGSQITYNKTSGTVIFLGHNDSWGSNWNKLYIALQYTKTTD